MTTANLNETVFEVETLPADIIEALAARAMCQGGAYMTAKQARQQHLDQVYDAYDQDAVKREIALMNRAEEYFAQGYRIHSTDRQMWGLSFDVPESALAWRIVSAGYIATSEARRVEYITKKAE